MKNRGLVTVTGNAIILVIELPETYNSFVVKPSIGIIKVFGLDNDNNKSGIKYIPIPKGKWKHLGKATELTEGGWNEIVDSVDIPWGDEDEVDTYYRDYEGSEKCVLIEGFATESGLSLLKANGILFENPFPKYFNNKFDGAKQIRKDWEQAESKVWRNCHLFIKQK